MTRHSRPSNLNARRSRGAVCVELAVTLPVLFLILMATVEACAMMHLTQSLYIAAYEATRVSLIPKSKQSDVEDAANQLLQSRKIKGSDIEISPNNFETAPIGTRITITVSAPAAANLPLAANFFRQKVMSGSCTMMKEY